MQRNGCKVIALIRTYDMKFKTLGRKLVRKDLYNSFLPFINVAFHYHVPDKGKDCAILTRNNFGRGLVHRYDAVIDKRCD